MTHQEKLAFIRGKVIEAVPEIVELTMGCEIERPGTGYIETIMLMETGVFMRWCATIYRSTLKLKYTYELTEYELETWKIIGRPIRLADVLLAIGHTVEGANYVVSSVLGMFATQDRNSGRLVGVDPPCWNLRKDDLNEQDEATISFLYEILK